MPCTEYTQALVRPLLPRVPSSLVACLHLLLVRAYMPSRAILLRAYMPSRAILVGHICPHQQYCSGHICPQQQDCSSIYALTSNTAQGMYALTSNCSGHIWPLSFSLPFPAFPPICWYYPCLLVSLLLPLASCSSISLASEPLQVLLSIRVPLLSPFNTSSSCRQPTPELELLNRLRVVSTFSLYGTSLVALPKAHGWSGLPLHGLTFMASSSWRYRSKNPPSQSTVRWALPKTITCAFWWLSPTTSALLASVFMIHHRHLGCSWIFGLRRSRTRSLAPK